MGKMRACVLGATGAAGQNIVEALVGRLSEIPHVENGFTYVVTSDNLEKGAGAVQNAEFMREKGYL